MMHVSDSHPVLHATCYMFMCTSVEGGLMFAVHLHHCAGVYKHLESLSVYEYADRVLEARLLPCCSPQRLWLASLSRTETSASICVAALRPYWWATMSCNKHGLCRSTPPAGESRARQETCEESRVLPVTRLWNKLLCCCSGTIDQGGLLWITFLWVCFVSFPPNGKAYLKG